MKQFVWVANPYVTEISKTLCDQPPPQALRFSHGRGERETSDW